MSYPLKKGLYKNKTDAFLLEKKKDETFNKKCNVQK